MNIQKILPLLFFFMFMALFLLYGELIIHDPILGYDDHSLVYPLFSIDSILDYRPIIDVQPVRDFSLLLDIFLKKKFEIPFFHLTNTTLWALTCIVFFSLLRTLDLPLPSSILLLLLICFHPIFVNSVAWLSARKHLLSALFILINTNFYLEISKRKAYRFLFSILIALFFTLSVFSQPITLLWPFWVIIWEWTKRYNESSNANEYRQEWKKIFAFLTPTLIVMIFAALLNTYYYGWVKYQGQVFENNSHPKFAGIDLKTLIEIGSAYGRYFFNLIFPFNLSISYRTSSWPNNIGFILFIGWLGLVIKKIPFKTYFPWISFYFLHLALVTFNMTHIFTSDTYILTSSFAFFYLTYFLFKKVQIKKFQRKIITLPLTFTIITLAIFQSYQTIQPWKNTLALYQNAYEQEPFDWTKKLYLLALVTKPEWTETPQKILNLLNETDDYFLAHTFVKRIFENRHLNDQNKIFYIDQVIVKIPSKYYFLTELFLLEKEYKKAKINFGKFLKIEKDELLIKVNKRRILKLKEILLLNKATELSQL